MGIYCFDLDVSRDLYHQPNLIVFRQARKQGVISNNKIGAYFSEPFKCPKPFKGSQLLQFAGIMPCFYFQSLQRQVRQVPRKNKY